jgi:NAD(P)-dependent dehydrogenase (short-subunit alcohol dehydrogenase family)
MCHQSRSSHNEHNCYYRASSGIGKATAKYFAEQGWNVDATDGKPQLRYLLGEDAKQTYVLREANGDDAFVAGMTQQLLA